MSHPHGQIYAFDHLPPITTAKAEAHRRHRSHEDRCLGCDVVARESASPRVVTPNDSFAVGVPFAARWPYEVAVRARRHGLSRLGDLDPEEQLDLTRAIRDVALRYDALFGFECPYLMVVQEAPRSQPDWHLAFEFFPLHRSRTTTKIRASVETATGLFLNDVLPEDAARRLAELEVSAAPIDADCLFVVEAAAGRNGHRPKWGLDHESARPVRDLAHHGKPAVLRRRCTAQRRRAFPGGGGIARRGGSRPGPRRAQAGDDERGLDPPALSRGERCCELRRRDLLDAHLLSGEDVDRRSRRAAEAAAPPAHPVQPGSSLVRDRHGLHEPEPVGARRPRVRVHRRPGCG